MKKILLLVGLVVANSGMAQNVFSEDFSGLAGVMPAGWTLINNDGLTPDPNVPQFTDAWIVAGDFDNAVDTVAMSTSWYSPAGTADDWMITPQVALTTNNTLTWEEEAQDAAYPDGYEVRISTTTPTIAGFMANPALFTIANASGAAWVTQSVDLDAAGYANQSVYIAWHNNATDQFVLMIDDISIDEPTVAVFDVAMSDTTREYTAIPLSQVTALGTTGEITETGGQAVTGATMTVNVYDGTMANVYSASSTPVGIAAGGSITATVAGYTPAIADVYTIEKIASINETDANLLNDTITYTVAVGEWYARDDASITISLGVGTGSTASLGNNFDVVNSEVLDSAFAVFSGTALLVGDTTQLVVYSTAAGVPTTQIGMSAEHIITAADTVGGVIILTLPITDMSSAPLTLAAGEYYVGANEYATTNNYGLAFTDNLFTYGSTYGSISGGAFATIESFGFPNTALVRAHFSSCPVSSTTFTESACETYTWSADGNTYTTSGQYDFVVGQNVCGADSIWTLDLTINTPDMVTETVSECDSYTWSADGNTYTATGTYTAVLTNAAGCDSTVTLDLTIGALDNTTTTAAATITANQAGATYQWIDCGNGNSAIGGETNQSYTATADGDYAVIITSGTCVDTSACVTIVLSGIGESTLAASVAMFPNPSNGSFTIAVADIATDHLDLEVTDATGKVMLTSSYDNVNGSIEIPVQLTNAKDGIYFVRIASAEGTLVERMIISKQ